MHKVIDYYTKEELGFLDNNQIQYLVKTRIGYTGKENILIINRLYLDDIQKNKENDSIYQLLNKSIGSKEKILIQYSGEVSGADERCMIKSTILSSITALLLVLFIVLIFVGKAKILLYFAISLFMGDGFGIVTVSIFVSIALLQLSLLFNKNLYKIGCYGFSVMLFALLVLRIGGNKFKEFGFSEDFLTNSFVIVLCFTYLFLSILIFYSSYKEE